MDEKQRLASVSYVTHGPTANGSHGPTANGNSKEHCRLSELVAKEKSCDPSLSLTSWQEEFRALFPNVNISFGGRLCVCVHVHYVLHLCVHVHVCVRATVHMVILYIMLSAS